ncbi:CRISPR-associated endonuclease Cas1 [Streptomyces chiangmaiensis]|uniref:CRISPR-associated endonuclease Cas1 n=1 Tax=Streptomyces chiangmaiensis TaxID=766497 RepID=A0ABU7FN79_9ACTN|nr:CRISPR-associated endonuclease Cas1 [Streptomyces chiangmaiensis]MED7825493.1 CRISPR-associated endonuclease Cas1 [Streptomyces chiangmaiensis]
MAELLHRAASEASLLDAWREVQANDLEDGVPNPHVSAYADGVLGRLGTLSTALRDGSWRPSPVYAMEIGKKSGGKRLLAVPAVEDRIVERAIMEVIDDIIDAVLLPWSYAYRKGLSVADALHDLATARDEGVRWVVRADIKDCFEKIPRWPALTRLREVVPDAEACHLIGQLVNRPGVGPAARRIRSGRGLHQGSSLSPVLTNLYLDSFDREMLRAGFRVLRYSDDFAVPVATQTEGERVLEFAEQALERLELDLNTDKSRIESFDEGVEFLGKTTTARSGTRAATHISPLESTVYVTEPGASLRTKGGRMRVVHRQSQLLSVPYERVRQVVCTAPVTLTSPFLRRALEHGIDVVLTEEDGEFLGRLLGPQGSDVWLRHEQHRLADKNQAKLALAASFVAGKIANMRTCLLRTARAGKLNGVETVADRLLAARRAALDAASPAVLMGTEGAATRDYFAALGAALGPTWAFTHRRRRPPPDPVNAMLSFGYTLLTREAVAAVELAGLDPAVGFLHEMRRSRPSLALDLVEEFRPVIVDHLVIGLCTASKVSPAGFATDESGERGCRMDRDTLRTFLAAYERRMLTAAHHPTTGRRVSYRTALTVQARHLANVITGRTPAYTPIGWR